MFESARSCISGGPEESAAIRELCGHFRSISSVWRIGYGNETTLKKWGPDRLQEERA
jgi:hypothetical protein